MDQSRCYLCRKVFPESHLRPVEIEVGHTESDINLYGGRGVTWGSSDSTQYQLVDLCSRCEQDEIQQQQRERKSASKGLIIGASIFAFSILLCIGFFVLIAIISRSP